MVLLRFCNGFQWARVFLGFVISALEIIVALCICINHFQWKHVFSLGFDKNYIWNNFFPKVLQWFAMTRLVFLRFWFSMEICVFLKFRMVFQLKFWFSLWFGFAFQWKKLVSLQCWQVWIKRWKKRMRKAPVKILNDVL